MVSNKPRKIRKNAIKTYDIVCSHCKCNFKITTSPSKAKSRKYCSVRCQRLGSRTRQKHKCIYCGKEFLVEPHRLKSGRGKFCSSKCKYGYGFSDDTKLKMSKQRAGRPNPAVAGSNSHFWKGGITSESKKARMSLEMREWRKKVFDRDGYTCQHCNTKGKILNAHHIKHFATHKDLRYVVDNGITLCLECHKKEHRQTNNGILTR